MAEIVKNTYGPTKYRDDVWTEVKVCIDETEFPKPPEFADVIVEVLAAADHPLKSYEVLGSIHDVVARRLYPMSAPGEKPPRLDFAGYSADRFDKKAKSALERLAKDGRIVKWGRDDKFPDERGWVPSGGGDVHWATVSAAERFGAGATAADQARDAENVSIRERSLAVEGRLHAVGLGFVAAKMEVDPRGRATTVSARLSLGQLETLAEWAERRS